MRTLWDALAGIAKHEGGLSCLVVPPLAARDYLPDGVDWSYGEVAERVQPLIDRYVARGWGHGHRVALLLENRPEFMLHFLALNAIGAWVIPINPDYREHDLDYLIRHSEPDLVVSISARAGYLRGVLRAVRPGLPITEEAHFADELPRAPRSAKAGAPAEGTEAVLLYTSGTTGMPKGCLIGNDYLFYAGSRYIHAGGAMRVEPKGERLYNPLPLFYANSLAISNPAMILSRNAMIFPDRFHPSSWWEEVVATRATIVHYLGVIPPLLLAREPVPEERTHRIRFGVGAGIDPPQQEEFQQRFGFPLVEVWGMSEVGIATAANEAPRGSGNRSIGRPLAEVELRIVGEQDRPLGKGQPGELVLRRAGSDPRAGFFRAYFRDEAATEEAWRGGWFHTGDIVRQEEDDSYTFVDRKKHMIRRSGQNIAAAEIEACLRAHPATAQVAVVAVPDEMRQEEVLACIVPRHMPSDPQRLARDIAEFTSTRLAYFKVPAWFFFLESLPTTATQKLQKGRIFGDDSDPRRRPGMIDLRVYKQALAKTRTAP